MKQTTLDDLRRKANAGIRMSVRLLDALDVVEQFVGAGEQLQGQTINVTARSLPGAKKLLAAGRPEKRRGRPPGRPKASVQAKAKPKNKKRKMSKAHRQMLEDAMTAMRKPCRVCNRPVDPRSFKRHEIACARKHGVEVPAQEVA